MVNRAEVKECLITRRAKVSAARAWLPEVGARRVPDHLCRRAASPTAPALALLASWAAVPAST